MALVYFDTPRKHQKTFRGYQKRPVAWNSLSFGLCQFALYQFIDNVKFSEKMKNELDKSGKFTFKPFP